MNLLKVLKFRLNGVKPIGVKWLCLRYYLKCICETPYSFGWAYDRSPSSEGDSVVCLLIANGVTMTTVGRME